MTTAELSGDAAVIAASRHDAEAFGVIYDRYAAGLHRYAYRRLGPQTAEDAVAETFLAAFRHRDRYDLGREDARPWLFGILTKEIARRWRTEQARYRALSRAGEAEAVEGFADEVDAAVSAQATRGALADGLRGLAARDRDVLLLVAWSGLTYEEVAQTLRIKVGTVRSRLHRARLKLREALGEDTMTDFFEVE
ncbi:RNA polymerase sigma factor [Catellatospora vulcania]|uniref:RNA polymerase sigma factor n=1 Tax=Catellatospora vulcania TaxID=1460450 RepID=UPI0012D37E34|nr:RNA polymerase sigma factor [Catellatospora vulcania]